MGRRALGMGLVCGWIVMAALWSCSSSDDSGPDDGGGTTSTASGAGGGDGGASTSSTSGAGGGGGAGGSSQTVPASWSKRFGTSAQGYRAGHGIAVGPNQEIAVIGPLQDDHGNAYPCTVAFGNTSLTADGNDAFVAMLDSMGTPQWATRVSSENSSSDEVNLNDVAIDSQGNTIVVGDFDGTLTLQNVDYAGTNKAVIIKFDSTGALLWGMSFPGQGTLTSVAVDSADDIIVGGFSSQFGNYQLDLGGGPLVPDAVVAKFTAAGVHAWSKAWASQTNAYGIHAIAVGPGDVIAATGASDLAADALNAWVLDLAPDGTETWIKTFGGPAWQVGRDDAFDANGNVYVAATFQSTIDFGGGAFNTTNLALAVAKLDTAGNHVYSRNVSAIHGCCLGSVIAVDAAGSLYVTGTAKESGTVVDIGGVTAQVGATNLFLGKLDPQGEGVWLVIGDATFSFGHAVALGSTGGPRIAGAFRNTLDLGAGPLTSVAQNDVVVAAFPP